MPTVFNDPNRPICPECQRPVARDKPGWYRCRHCNRRGTSEQWANGLVRPVTHYKQQEPEHDPVIDVDDDDAESSICYACEMYPASPNGDGLCSRCMGKLSRGRFAAAQMSDAEKQAHARQMAAVFMEIGIVRLRPLALRVPDSHYLKRGKYGQTDANTNRTGDGDTLRCRIPGSVQGERASELQAVG